MNFIVAVDENYGIGKDNKLLTYIPGDLPRFKEITAGKTIVMGRKTLESLPGGKPLPNRRNIVLSRNEQFECEGVTVVHNIEELMACIKDSEEENVFVIGGGIIYNMLIPYCKYGYITKMEKGFDADTFINNVEEMPNWHLIDKSEAYESEGMTYYFTKYENSENKK